MPTAYGVGSKPYVAELNKRCRPPSEALNKSNRVDETYIKVKGQEKYFYRAVNSHRAEIDFLLPPRDLAAAKSFFERYFALLVTQGYAPTCRMGYR
ncbi:DDE-type integrase/transposase/recombinase [Acidobacterium sp. S8]|uniref:DDE-type integrase/transposase/recombinase n=1 Tax=Acidobacterium sp. S8 TaxID=1641854 RepID=UPI00131C80A2